MNTTEIKILIASTVGMGWTPANSSIDNIVKTAWARYNSAEYRGRA